MYSFFFLLLFLGLIAAADDSGYHGKKIGPLTELHHGVSGDVYVVDDNTIHLRNFNYDGEGPGKLSLPIIPLI